MEPGIAELQGPIIGYFDNSGAQKHIDYPLIIYLALRHPDWTLLLLGLTPPIDAAHLPNNIVFIESSNERDWLEYTKYLRAGFIPCVGNRLSYLEMASAFSVSGKRIISKYGHPKRDLDCGITMVKSWFEFESGLEHTVHETATTKQANTGTITELTERIRSLRLLPTTDDSPPFRSVTPTAAASQLPVRVSVVVPAFNSERYISETIESVLEQTFQDWELIVVDDGSTDRTTPIAYRYAEHDSRIRILRQPNGGLANAHNAGTAAASKSSDYVAFLDSDDVWEPNALQLLVERLDAKPNAAAVHGIARFIDEHGWLYLPGVLESSALRRRAIQAGEVTTCPVDQPTTVAMLAYNCCVVNSGVVLIRASSLREAGSFDENASPSDDWDMWLRLALVGDLEFIPYAILRYRRHAGNVTRKTDLMAEKAEYVVSKLMATAIPDPAISNQIKEALHFRQLDF